MLAVLGTRKSRLQAQNALREAFAGISLRRITSVVAAVTVLSFAATGFKGWLYSPSVWPVNDVQVSGVFRHLDEQQLAQVVSGLRGQNLFACDLEAVKAVIAQQPWIDSVAVRRQWPGTVAVEIKEQLPFARWADGGLVNVRGELFVPPEHNLPGLPVLRGPGPQSAPEVLSRYRELSAALAPTGMRLELLALDSRGAWQAQMNNGLKVILGRRLDERSISRLVRAYPRVIAPELENIERVDLRYPNGFAVRWRPETKAM